MILAIAFPNIDPVAIEIGPLAIRWYALAYVSGLILGWLHVRALARQKPAIMTARDADDLLLWVTLGVVLGGRVGYVLFYKSGYYASHLDEIFAVWRGGMSFHGGLLGVAAAMVLFARVRKLKLLEVADVVVCAVPIGLFFGRVANFVNGELWGRASNASWAMAFPHAGPEPRHPSQLYEAALEGIVLFVLLFAVRRLGGARARPGELTGAFCALYAVLRMIGELFRQPDAHLGFLFAGVTMGQLLSIPLLVFGIALFAWARRRAAD